MPLQYYIRTRGTVRGPFPPEKLKELARRGQFSRVYHVSLDGETWEPAADHPELLPEAIAVKIRKQPIEADSEDSAYDMAEPPPDSGGSAGSLAAHEQQPDTTLWYYATGGSEMGPVSFAELRQLVLRGVVRYNDPVWAEGMSDWMEALSVPELFAEATADEMAAASTAPQIDTSANVPGATSPLAITSLVCGVLGLTICSGLASIPAVIFGHVALRQIKASRDAIGGRGLAKAGLILGYVGLGISAFVLLIGLAVLALRMLGAFQ